MDDLILVKSIFFLILASLPSICHLEVTAALLRPKVLSGEAEANNVLCK